LQLTDSCATITKLFIGM